MAAALPLYQDKFVEIFDDHLRIKSYYFPFGKAKVINIPSVSGAVSFSTDRDLDFSLWDWKVWGMALNNVWWAPDWQRCSLSGNRNLGIVITVEHERFRKGFSVEDATAALKVLEELLPRTEHQRPA
ncbi:unnamed protein product [Symbiodinium natans]|uniref:Uncharacterized protein n=1 Tax=Symbiodinium natans TaxID=878477 RepID=A0A812QK80_9DINO|nr:unnamed protein product [Symbiodinium natans]